jgi:hypothetical protein
VTDGTNPAPTRVLVWVPILHAAADHGSLSGAVKAQYVRRHGATGWDRHAAAIAAVWRNIRTVIDDLRLDPRTVRLYQDGLPDGGHELEVVRALAAAGSPNHRILAELVARGAKLTGTESVNLLREEYEYATRTLRALTDAPPGAPAAPGTAGFGAELLARRDRYIADRIAATLVPGETGLLFLGLLHSLDGLLPPDVAVSRLRFPLPPALAGG